jgi:hypothetical protein
MLLKMYCLAEKLIDTRCQNNIINAVVQITRMDNRFPSYINVKVLYDGTPRDSPACKLVVDMYLRSGDTSWLPDDSDKCHKDFGVRPGESIDG